MKTKTIVHKSAAPIYAAAVTWVLYALLFPLYQVGHFLLAAAASAVVALIARMFCRDVTETVEVPEEPVSTGNVDLDKAIAEGRNPYELADGEYVTSCTEVCPNGAISFGDSKNPEHKVYELIRSPHAFRLLERLGTDPQVYYLSKREWVRRQGDNYLENEKTKG